MRLIDADALIQALCADNDGIGRADAKAVMTCLEDVFSIVDDAPTIDIVSCQDCKHCKRRKGTFRGEPIFFYRCTEHNRDVESDDFCSFAERSEK